MFVADNLTLNGLRQCVALQRSLEAVLQGE